MKKCQLYTMQDQRYFQANMHAPTEKDLNIFHVSSSSSSSDSSSARIIASMRKFTYDKVYSEALTKVPTYVYKDGARRDHC